MLRPPLSPRIPVIIPARTVPVIVSCRVLGSSRESTGGEAAGPVVIKPPALAVIVIGKPVIPTFPGLAIVSVTILGVLKR